MLALITGSGFYSLASLTQRHEHTIDTPYGAATVTQARWNDGPPVLFMPRHGSDHSVPPHAINYRANIWALREADASAILATAVSGGIADTMQPGAFVVIDDFIDFTSGRPSTFYGDAGPGETGPGETGPGDTVRHTDMSVPYAPDLRASISLAATRAAIDVIDGGVYCATNGPRFESKAEIEMMRRLGGDLVGMTGCPEVVLAGELGLPYASIGVISNRAAGLADRELSVPEIMGVLADAAGPLERLIDAVVELYQEGQAAPRREPS